MKYKGVSGVVDFLSSEGFRRTQFAFDNGLYEPHGDTTLMIRQDHRRDTVASVGRYKTVFFDICPNGFPSWITSAPTKDLASIRTLLEERWLSTPKAGPLNISLDDNGRPVVYFEVSKTGFLGDVPNWAKVERMIVASGWAYYGTNKETSTAAGECFEEPVVTTSPIKKMFRYTNRSRLSVSKFNVHFYEVVETFVVEASRKVIPMGDLEDIELEIASRIVHPVDRENLKLTCLGQRAINGRSKSADEMDGKWPKIFPPVVMTVGGFTVGRGAKSTGRVPSVAPQSVEELPTPPNPAATPRPSPMPTTAKKVYRVGKNGKISGN